MVSDQPQGDSAYEELESEYRELEQESKATRRVALIVGALLLLAIMAFLLLTRRARFMLD